ncbi:hypothetical protein KSB_73700 [Ktedonobacter robiniae]|uniref:Uncharacterized protein n=1 Tax=Ktedonobacter robiniae TaxID=2778365 RepID=A0ABQ3V2N8_9CHLR|nr:hypothetical protein KSB_73700 [Ktedonobacter robiniae]
MISLPVHMTQPIILDDKYGIFQCVQEHIPLLIGGGSSHMLLPSTTHAHNYVSLRARSLEAKKFRYDHV